MFVQICLFYSEVLFALINVTSVGDNNKKKSIISTINILITCIFTFILIVHNPFFPVFIVIRDVPPILKYESKQQHLAQN